MMYLVKSGRWRKWFSPLLIALLTGACSFSDSEANGEPWQEKPAASAAAAKTPAFAELNASFVNLVKELSPSVVNIYTKTKITFSRQPGFFSGPGDEFFQFFFGTPFDNRFQMPTEQEAVSLGSGFVLNDQGIIITNSHVIRPNGKKADEVMIKFKDQTGQGFPAEVVGYDESTDVAVLKLKNKPKSLKAVFLGDSDNLQVGEWVLAIGNPYGHANTVTQGIVSALGRHLEGLGNRADFIQTSASINPGNSGGPLFNLKGEVVGINTAIDARAQGIGFSIPITMAKPIIKQLVETGKVIRGWIGIGIADLTPELKKLLKVPADQGVVVQSVEDDQPADKAGVKVYDVVVKVNGEPTESAHDLSNIIAGIQPGNKVELEIYRDGGKKTVDVKVAERPLNRQLASNSQENEPQATEREGKIGLALSDLTPELKRRFDIDSSTQGVLVTDVARFSPASQLGFAAGDIITEINKKPVGSAEEVIKRIDQAKKKEESLLFKVLKANGWSTLIVVDMANF